MKKPELLSPAGDMEKLNMALRYGADAVYLAGTSFGMRSFAGNFSPEELPKAVALAHSFGVRVHVTVNTMARDEELERLPAHRCRRSRGSRAWRDARGSGSAAGTPRPPSCPPCP